MCGRYVLKRKDLEEMLRQFGIRSLEEYHSRFNIAPTTAVPVIRETADRAREAVALRWGLVPSWSKDSAGGARLCNARAEGVAEKPSFRHAFRKKRCVVPASGFYEWQTIGRLKLPWYFSPREDVPLALAGLWESWKSPDGTWLETCSLITTSANAVVGRIHDRMPVILERRDADTWLDRKVDDPAALLALLKPFPAEKMTGLPVNPRVNRIDTDGPECLEPAPVPAPGEPPPPAGPQLSLGFD